MDDSILNTTKKILGLEADYTAFDLDILTHINSVLVTLSQLGIGPTTGFVVEDNSKTWGDLLGTDPLLNSVKTYIYLRVRMWFDPPVTGYHVTAMNEQIRELEWRLNTYREGTAWVDPDPDPPVEEEELDSVFIDGGSP